MLDWLDLVTVSRMSDEWDAIVRSRDSYLYLTEWELTHWLFVPAAAFLFLVAYTELRHQWSPQKVRDVSLLLAIPAVFALISFVTVDLLQLANFLHVQLLRSLMMAKVLVAILFAWYAYRYAQNVPRDWLFNFFAIGTVASMLVKDLLTLIFVPFFALLWFERHWRAPKSHATLDIPQWIHHGIFLVAFAVSALMALPGRDFLVPFLLATLGITVVAVITVSWRQRPTYITVFAVLLMVTLYAAIPPARPFNIYPAVASEVPFQEACRWIIANIRPDAVFAAEPYSSVGEEVKLLCGRNLYYSNKDGAQVIFNEPYALEWQRRRSFLTADLSPSQLFERLRHESVHYVVSTTLLHEVDDSLVYANNSYFIYEL